MTHLGTRTHDANPFVRLAERVESAEALDGLSERLAPLAAALVADPHRRDLLEGTWLGHALHPLMTDAPVGFWVSGTLLDVLGGDDKRSAARLLIGLGVVSALPTALTGLTEWAALTERRDRRTGSAHAALNGAALVLYAGSWLAHRRRHDRLGTRLALAGGAVTAASGYLGGHLTAARRVSTRHPAFQD